MKMSESTLNDSEYGMGTKGMNRPVNEREEKKKVVQYEEEDWKENVSNTRGPEEVFSVLLIFFPYGLQL